jgi:hypothetical protein
MLIYVCLSYVNVCSCVGTRETILYLPIPTYYILYLVGTYSQDRSNSIDNLTGPRAKLEQ